MKKVAISALSILTVLFFVSCGSKPAPEEEIEPESPVVTESVEEVIEDESEAETDDSEETAISREESIAKVDAARKMAVEAGAEVYAAELLRKIDSDYEALVTGSEDIDISVECEKLARRYEVLAETLKAIELKQKIDDLGFEVYDPKDYNDGCMNLAQIREIYNSGDDIDSSVDDKAKAAYSSFNKVLVIAYKKLAQDERALAFKAKQDADSIKAGVAQKESYNEAVEEFKMGDTVYSMQNPESAYNHYKLSKEQFIKLYNDVKTKREEAQRIMEEAKKRVAEAEKFAEQADNQAPINEAVDGIEDADAVLLEEDEYDDEEIKVDEVLEDEELDNYDFSAVEALEEESEDDEEADELEELEEAEIEDSEELAEEELEDLSEEDEEIERQIENYESTIPEESEVEDEEFVYQDEIEEDELDEEEQMIMDEITSEAE